MLFSYFVYIAYFTKFTSENSLFMEKPLRVKKSKRKKVLEKKGKNRSKEERKSTILLRKEKNCFVKATGTGGAPLWRPDFQQNLPDMMLNEVFFSLCK